MIFIWFRNTDIIDILVSFTIYYSKRIVQIDIIISKVTFSVTERDCKVRLGNTKKFKNKHFI